MKVKCKYVAKHSLRMNAIRSRVVLKSSVICSKCGRIVTEETIYEVDRWTSAKKIECFRYCKNCARSKEQVLNIIDSDQINYGIALVDDFFDYEKGDPTKHKALVNKLLKGFLH